MDDQVQKLAVSRRILGTALGLFLPGLGHLYLYGDWRRGLYWSVCAVGSVVLTKYLNPHFEFLTYDRVLTIPIVIVSLLDLWQYEPGPDSLARKIGFFCLFVVLPALFFGALWAGRQVTGAEVLWMAIFTGVFVVVYWVKRLGVFLVVFFLMGSVLVAQEKASDPIKDPTYLRLHHALVVYQNFVREGGWPQISAGPKLQVGDRGARVIALRERLQVTGELKKKNVKEPELFDESLAESVKKFQSHHGLEEDGAVGKATFAALNVSAEQRVRQIEHNLARWPLELRGEPGLSVVVNIPDFRLDLMEDGKSILDMRVVVGLRNWQTPILDATMTHVVLNPKWHVPTKIAKQEVIPDIRKDPDYLKKKGMRVFARKDEKVEEVDPESIDWDDTEWDFGSLIFRQDSGDANALGRIKFLFPNKYDVYLHDTPSKSFFKRAYRALSHGCIRVEKPLDLAERVLAAGPNGVGPNGADPHWTTDEIQAGIKRGGERFVKLPQPIPVHLIYRTVWVDGDGTIQFREDIYGHDRGAVK